MEAGIAGGDYFSTHRLLSILMPSLCHHTPGLPVSTPQVHSSLSSFFPFILWTTITSLSLKYFPDYHIFLLTYLAGSPVPAIFTQGGFSQPEPNTHGSRALSPNKPSHCLSLPVCSGSRHVLLSLPSSFSRDTHSLVSHYSLCLQAVGLGNALISVCLIP